MREEEPSPNASLPLEELRSSLSPRRGKRSCSRRTSHRRACWLPMREPREPLPSRTNGGNGMSEMGEQRDKHNVPNMREQNGDGEVWTFSVRAFNSTLPEHTINMNYDGFAEDVRVGDELVVDGEMVRFEVIEKIGPDVKCLCTNPGLLLPRANLTFSRNGSLYYLGVGKTANFDELMAAARRWRKWRRRRKQCMRVW
ncbi:hypothetical protein Ahy_B06g083465 [Arachis hypogaea]|uniref:Pyruvate kinase barrel domain-containing protein n=1 Tax=Arachis hypogaea TaxID=3818 RepID=A0A444YQ24_ARAHY|nr:hypothetical protein Ahy_B06g083465 [Arachis hypogaea]